MCFCCPKAGENNTCAKYRYSTTPQKRHGAMLVRHPLSSHKGGLLPLAWGETTPNRSRWFVGFAFHRSGRACRSSRQAHLYNGPATVKSLKCKIDQKSCSSGPDFSRKSASTFDGKVAGARSAAPSHFSGKLLGLFPFEIRPRRATFLIDFAFTVSDFAVAGP